ncbi:MAG TPA: hypothetical protein VGH98_17260 [Gemmatimonadaceae bacterium]|jgi:hypothetical protein
MRRLIGTALLVMLAACGGDSTGPKADITGNYTLRTVNGSAVPAVVFQDASEKDELTGGNISLGANNTWTGLLSARVTDLTTSEVFTGSAPASGSYTNSGGSITLTVAQDGSQLIGSVASGTLTLSGDIGVGSAVTMVFQR